MAPKPSYITNPSAVIVNPDFSYVSPNDGKTYMMSMKEKLFCDAYLSFKGDAVDAVFEAGYDCKNANVASVMAFDLLRKPNLIAYINSKFEEYGFNDDNAFKQHLFLMQQHSDYKTKAKAIDMYYKLKGSYAPEKKDITLSPGDQPLSDDDKQLLEILNEHERNKGTKAIEIDGTQANVVDTEVQDQERGGSSDRVQ